LQILAARLAFVVVFEHLVFFLKVIIEMAVPDVPKDVKLAVNREDFLAQQVRQCRPAPQVYIPPMTAHLVIAAGAGGELDDPRGLQAQIQVVY
jgi:hypothetical protein